MKSFLVVSLVLFTSCAHGPSTKERGLELKRIVDDHFEQTLRMHPLFATSIGDHRFDDQLENGYTPEAREKERALTSSTLIQLQELGCKNLSEQDQLTCEIITDDLMAESELQKVSFGHLMPIDQFGSFPADFAELATGSSFVSFNTVQDYKNFLKRSDRVPEIIDSIIANMKEGIQKKITTPQVLIQKALKQLDDLIVPDFRKSVFYKPLAAPKPGVTIDAGLKSEYEATIQNKIYPAYRKLRDYVRGQYLAKARKTSGLKDLPGGAEYYKALARINTTTDLSPEQIHDLGLSEVKRIREQFEAAKSALGFKGDLKSFFTAMQKQDPKFYPFKTEKEVLDAYREIYTRVMKKIPAHFRLVPKAAFEIREVEKFKAESAAEAYQNGSPDGSRPGIFWVPIPNPKKYNNREMEALFLHEAIPGHHFQISIQQELSDFPRYRRFSGNNAYVEGWALYTESLGKDLGMYADGWQWIGRLGMEMHRAIRLVVDTGLHSKGWSREQAIQYSLDNEPRAKQGIVSEVERYMAIPGQALSYKLGELTIQHLKKRAQDGLGAQYSDPDFHDEILKDGALPLTVLQNKIGRWIKSRRN